MSIDKDFEKDDRINKSKGFSSSISNALSALYLKDSLGKGRDISIPSLGITIYARDYNGKTCNQ